MAEKNKKLSAIVKLQILAGKATPAPPVGSALGPHGINIVNFTKEFNDKTKDQVGMTIPVVVSIYQDKSFSFEIKTPPASVLILKECGIEKGSGVPNKTKVSKISMSQLKKIAEIKVKDLTSSCIDSAVSMVAGTAKSMGIEVTD